MTAHIELSPLDLAVTAAVVNHEHFYTWPEGAKGTRCLICGTTFETAEAWAADDGVCPGYTTCGMDPVLTQPLSVGPEGATRG